ncbi:MAG: carnitine dehydratase [Piscirickettsiaceae bacterium]|nr:MAG: carnitine dehydratase [Piscirickettsiaceae bacterium]
MNEVDTAPLEGIRIIEVTHMLAGPYCGMLLADLGAEVIKIETGSGDLGRQMGTRYVGEQNVYFASLNRNKKSICLDLSSDAGQAKLHALVKDSHALICNLRPAAIKKLGLTYQQLKKQNDKIVCLAITGYGLEGPYADKPAYDYVIQALAGVIALTGEPDGPPIKCGYSVVDNIAGNMGGLGLLAKIVQGKGGQIDLSLYDTMLSQLNYLAADYLNGGEDPKRHRGGGHPYLVPAQLFPTKVGHVALFISHDRFWQKFAMAVDRPEWVDDAQFATVQARSENREMVVSTIESLFAEQPADYWVKLLDTAGVVIAGVQTLGQSLDGELTASQKMLIEIPTPEGMMRFIGNPLKMEGCTSPKNRAPLLGEHTKEVCGNLS